MSEIEKNKKIEYYWGVLSYAVFSRDLDTVRRTFFALKAIYDKEKKESDDITYEKV